jgi:hypothetical protein
VVEGFHTGGGGIRLVLLLPFNNTRLQRHQ